MSALLSADPRGPSRKVTAVDGAHKNLITYDCGHTAELNPIYSYTVGSYGHCFQCKREGRDCTPCLPDEVCR